MNCVTRLAVHDGSRQVTICGIWRQTQEDVFHYPSLLSDCSIYHQHVTKVATVDMDLRSHSLDNAWVVSSLTDSVKDACPTACPCCQGRRVSATFSIFQNGRARLMSTLTCVRTPAREARETEKAKARTSRAARHATFREYHLVPSSWLMTCSAAEGQQGRCWQGGCWRLLLGALSTIHRANKMCARKGARKAVVQTWSSQCRLRSKLCSCG